MRVLIVEDETKMAAFLKQGLEEQRYAVDVAHNGEDGLHWALNFPYDILILDVMLPGIDGFQLCKELRNQSVQFGLSKVRDAVTAKGPARIADRHSEQEPH